MPRKHSHRPMTPAKQKANRRWDEAHMHTISARVPVNFFNRWVAFCNKHDTNCHRAIILLTAVAMAEDKLPERRPPQTAPR